MCLNIECLPFDDAKMRAQKANSISSTWCVCVCVLVGVVCSWAHTAVCCCLLLLLSQVALVFHFKGTPEARLLSRLKHICKAEVAAAARTKADFNASDSRGGRAAHNQIVPERFQAGVFCLNSTKGRGSSRP